MSVGQREPETFDDVALDEEGNEAFRLVTRERTGDEPVQTADLLGALARTDAHGTWERIWLATEVWELAEERPGFRDPRTGGQARAATYRGVALSPATARAFRTLRRMRSAYDLDPLPRGAFAIALVGDPSSGAARTLLARSALTHDELVHLVESELLGVGLPELDEVLGGSDEPDSDPPSEDDLDPGQLMMLLIEFAAVPTLAHARRLVEEHAALRGPVAAAAMDYQLRLAQEDGDPGMVAAVRSRRHLLRRCRDVGIAAAFGEAERNDVGDSTSEPPADVREIGSAIMRFVGASTWGASRRVLDDHPLLLTDRADAALDVMIQGATEAHSEVAVEQLRRHQRLLRRCRQVGVHAAFAEIEEPESDDDPPLTELVRMFVLAPTVSEAERLLGRWPELVSEDAVAQVEAVADVVTREGDTHLREGVQARLEVLRRALVAGSERLSGRAAGRDRMLDVLLRSLGDGPDELADLVRREPDLLSADVSEVERRLEAARRAGNAAMTAALEQLRSFTQRTDSVQDLVADIDEEERSLVPALFAFFRSDTWEDARRVVDRHPELLSVAAERMMGRFLAAAERSGDERAARTIRAHRGVLTRAREVGVAEAFADVDRAGGADSGDPVAVILGRVAEARAEMEEMDIPAEARIEVLGKAAEMFLMRHDRSGAREALDAAVRCWEWARETTGPRSDHAATVANNLAGVLTRRFTTTGDAADLVTAVEVLRTALGAGTLTPADRVGLLTTLGNTLVDLGDHIGDRLMLSEAIVVYESAVAAAGGGADNRTGLQVNLSEGLRRRYELDRNDADLDDMIDALREAVAAARADDPLLPDAADNLAASLVDRFDRAARRGDLDEAIGIYQTCGLDVGDWARLGGYASAQRRRFRLDGDVGALEEAEHAYRCAAAMAPDGSRIARSLTGLGEVLQRRYRHSREPALLDSAVETLEQAVDMAPAGQDHATALSALADALVDRFGLSGRLADLDAAIAHEEHGLLDLAPDAPEWAASASAIGYRHLARSRFSEGTADLDAAVDWSERGVRSTAVSSPDLARHQAVHGLALGARYRALGDPVDLERSLAAHASAVAAAGEDSPESTQHLTGWGYALLARYVHAGDAADIDGAIAAFRRAAATVDGSEAAAEARSGLATCLRTRAANDAAGEGLDEAIGILDGLVATEPAGSPYRPGRLANLAHGLDDRYDRDHNENDLDRAIALYRAALDAGSPQWRDRWRVSVSLASVLIKQNSGAPTAEDVAESIRRCEQAVQETDGRSPEMSHHLAALANALRQRGGPDDIVAAAGQYRRCCELAARNDPRSVLVAANVWGTWAAQRRSWSEMAEAYDHGSRALRALVGQQVSRTDKLGWMLGARRMTSGLAYALAVQGDVEAAVVAAERGRAVLLAEKVGGSISGGAETSYGTVASAATAATICYLVAASPGGVALLVSADSEPRAVLLPDLPVDAVRERTLRHVSAYVAWLATGDLASWEAQLDDLGHWLWTAAMGPVLDARVPGTKQLVLVPGGYLGLLPLHAACTPDPNARTGRRYAIDEVGVSYCASATAYAAARAAATTVPDSILVVEDPTAPASPLAGAQVEADDVLRTFSGSQPLRSGADAAFHLRGPAATRALVAAGDQAVLHLCCHGSSNANEPLDSALAMADGGLTVADLTRRRRRPARLVVLSACESAMHGAEIPDEVVGFPTGLIQSGVGGVIGTQWCVAGPVAAAIVRRFYNHWRVGGLEPAEALRRAQREVRDRTSAPHPSGWAAMTYNGA